MTAYDLDELSRARRLSRWMFDQYAHRVGGDVAELGPGVGTFSERLLQRGIRRLHLVEPDPAFADVLERRFAHDPRTTLARETLPDAPSLLDGQRFDFLLCQNVLEHVAEHEEALRTMAHALRPGGRLTLLVPAGPRLYGSLDRAFGHHRRYTPAMLHALVEAAGLRMVDMYAFNLLGVLGWWVKGHLGARRLGAGSLRVYETLLPLWRPVEARLRPPWGLSLVAHVER
jgi:2-polyprenyl-3-methyl-5-hydroxy-6-metoxy-1,4-benzoquinol methylase